LIPKINLKNNYKQVLTKEVIMIDVCPSFDKCPIFNGILLGKDFTTASYKRLYCEAGEQGRLNCRRWQMKQKYGKVPNDLLPNAMKTLEEIAKENNY
jgi:hypothetical protein